MRDGDAGSVRNSWELWLHRSAERDALRMRGFNLIFHFLCVDGNLMGGGRWCPAV